MKLIASLICGLIFGIGLIISGMTDPLKVQNFLDLFGTWDPSLAFVMGGAIAVTAPGYAFLRKLSGGPLFAERFQFPTRNDLDTPLLAGSATFGVGWGLGGFCPGPALAALPLFAPQTIVFVVMMIAGLALSNAMSAGRPAPASA